MRPRPILQLLENIWGNLVLVAAGTVARRCILGTRLFYHPPVHIENGESKVPRSAILIFFDSWTTSTVAREIELVQKLMWGNRDFWSYSSFMMIARSVFVKPMFTQFCLLLAASPGSGEWKIAWPVQSRSMTKMSIFRQFMIEGFGSSVDLLLSMTELVAGVARSVGMRIASKYIFKDQEGILILNSKNVSGS